MDDEREKMITGIIVALDLTDFYGYDINATLRASLSGFSDSTLDLIEATTAWNAARGNHHYDFMPFTINELPERLVREIMFYRPMLTASDDEPGYISGFVIGLHTVERFSKVEHLEELVGDELSIAAAFLNVMTAINDYDPLSGLTADCEFDGLYGSYISDDSLQRLIADHHRKADAIISYIEERKSADPKTILPYLENGTVLRTGVL